MDIKEIESLLASDEFKQVIQDAANYQRPGYPLQVAIGLDAFVDSFSRDSILGMTISSRAATAAAHGHFWGKVMWWLLDRVWPFGCNKDGTPHCVDALKRDAARGLLQCLGQISDPVVNAFVKTHTTKLPFKEL